MDAMQLWAVKIKRSWSSSR